MSGFDRFGLIAHGASLGMLLAKLFVDMGSWWLVFAPMLAFWGYVVVVMVCVAWEVGWRRKLSLGVKCRCCGKDMGMGGSDTCSDCYGDPFRGTGAYNRPGAWDERLFPCGHPRMVAAAKDVRCSICDRERE